MVSPVFLPALLLTSAWAQQPPPASLEVIASLVSRSFLSLQGKLDTLLADDTCELRMELVWETVQSVLNATSQLQEDNELLRGRQAASAAVQATQLLLQQFKVLLLGFFSGLLAPLH